MGAGTPREAVTKEIQREMYDLSHPSFMVGAIGCLQTFSRIPVVAGDSMKIDFKTQMRLSPLRRYLYLDAQVDLAAFYIPHRHIYGASGGSDWVTFMRNGFDEAVNLGTDTLPAGVGLNCVGMPPSVAATLPRHVTRGYMQIYRRYYADPTDTVAQALPDNYWTTVGVLDTTVHTGLPICNLKNYYNSAILATTSTADYRLPLSGGEVDLIEFAALQGRYKTEQQRDWFDFRYADLLRHTWGSENVNIDADQRPELLGRKISTLSGFDVQATDQAALGTYSGVGVGIADLSIPWKFFPEHGTVWIMGAVRFPQLNTRLGHYLDFKAEPTYAQIAGDPSIVGRTGPIDLQTSDLFVGGGAVSLGRIPYAQWYREHHGHIHQEYELVAGHPFLTSSPASRTAAVYVDPANYASIFQSTMLRHWNSQGMVHCKVKRFIPDVRTSIFAGTGTQVGA